MTGSLPDGQDREQKVNNSALPRGLIPVSVGTESPNGNSASSELYTTTQLHSQFPSPSAIHGQPPIRAQSLLARKRIQKACNPPDLASDGETEQGPRKRARTELQVDKEEQFCIGYHINEPRLPIFASLGVSNKLYVHALKEQTPIDVLERWDLLVTNGSQVALEKTVLDRDIFPLSLGNLENLDRKKVAGLIKESIEAKRDGRQMKVEGVSTSQEKHVGFHKDDHEVPVYARMQLKTSGISYPTFNAHKSDAEKSTVDFKNRLVSYKDIRYIGKYARENLEESRKAIQEDLSTVSQSEGRF
jgi:hypothetical protein